MTDNKNMDDSKEGNVLIDYPQVVVGMYLVRQNAKRIFQDAKFLYDNQKFQSAIPIFIISLEEALKSHQMASNLGKKNLSILMNGIILNSINISLIMFRILLLQIWNLWMMKLQKILLKN